MHNEPSLILEDAREGKIIKKYTSELVNYREIIFWTNEAKIDKVRNMLMKEHGLVPPKDDPFQRTEEEVLVWEDKQGTGRYRVEFNLYHPKGPIIYFRYWTEKLIPKIGEEDPMLEVLRKTYKLIKPADKIKDLTGGFLKEITESFEEELKKKKLFDFEILNHGLNWDYIACIKRFNVKKEKGLFSKKKKVKKYEPVMIIEYSGHRPKVLISYCDQKWKNEAKNLEEKLKCENNIVRSGSIKY